MAFTPDEFLNGILAIMWVSTAAIVGIVIASRYRKYKEMSLIYVGICWIAIAGPWWGASISFIIGLFNDGVGLLDMPQLYMLIGTPGTAILLPLWMWVISGLIKKEKQKLITSVSLTVSIAYLIYFFIFLWSPLKAGHPIGELQSPVDLKYNGLSSIYMAYTISFLVLSGIIFSIQLLKSENSENKLKGKFILICFVCFGVGAILDSIVTLNIISLLLIRGILILSAFSMYCGWLLPKWVKNIFLK